MQRVCTLAPDYSLPSQISRELFDLQQRGLLRCPDTTDSSAGKTSVVDGREIRVFCSNNYLDLANHPRILEAVREGLSRWGWGTAASRLISGSTTAHVSLEQQLAQFKHTEAAVLFPTGYMANLGLLTALAGSGDVLLIDKLCHASIIDAARAARGTNRFFVHNDMKRLAELLRRYSKARRICIVTEGIFSMDGDLADLSEIVSLKNKYKALLIVDDAHGTGVLGENGRGTAELLNVEQHIDVTVATLSKAFGSLGGFVCCSSQLARYLRNRSRSYIYTTAAPAVVCLAAQAALEIIQQEPQRRNNLQAVGKKLRDALCQAGFEIGSAQAQIVPIILGRNELALQFSQLLWQQGFMIPAIREPSVPRGKARLRISLMSCHNCRDIDELLEALVSIAGELGVLDRSGGH